MSPSTANAAALRRTIEDQLAAHMPGALTPLIREESTRFPCGIEALDEALQGGLPVGAITELAGPAGSGRSSLALAYAAASARSGGVAAWIDTDDELDPESASHSGVDLARLLWVRCRTAAPAAAGVLSPVEASSVPGAHGSVPGGGGSPHPRSEGRGMPEAVQDLLLSQPRSAAQPAARRRFVGTPSAPNRPVMPQAFQREEQIATDRLPPRRGEQLLRTVTPRPAQGRGRALGRLKPDAETSAFPAPKISGRSWTPLDHALRATDLLLQSGGFGLIVLDLGSTPPEMAWRIPLATWFRFRAACERTGCSLLLLTQRPCARSSVELLVGLQPGCVSVQGNVLTGVAFGLGLERSRSRFAEAKVVSIRKPPQPARPGQWAGQTAWAI